MSWGTEFKADIFLTHMTFESMGQLEGVIADKKKEIMDAHARIKMWAISTPKDVFTTADRESLVSTVSFEVEDLLAEYSEALLLLKDLDRYLEYVKENNINLSNNHDKDAD